MYGKIIIIRVHLQQIFHCGLKKYPHIYTPKYYYILPTINDPHNPTQ